MGDTGMVNHIHQALAQVREIRQHVVGRTRFRGYSGRARMASGSLALCAAVVMTAPGFPDTDLAHLAGWGAVFCAAIAMNYGALLYWFLHDPAVGRDVRKLRPTLDVFPPLILGIFFPQAREQELTTVRSPSWRAVVPGSIRQLPWRAAGGGHYKHVSISFIGVPLPIPPVLESRHDFWCGRPLSTFRPARKVDGPRFLIVDQQD